MQDLTHTTPGDSTTAVIAVAVPEENVSTMFCTQCGTRNGSDAKFCKQCGRKLERTGPLKISEEEFLLPESPEEKVRNLLILAFQKYEVGDLDAALAVCAEAVEIRPGSTDAHSLMSTLYEKKGDQEKAIAERERVLGLNPGSIADREKLDELKDGHPSLTSRKVTSSHRTVGTTLIDSPAAQAFAAVFVMLIVLGIGAAMLWAARPNKTTTANAANKQTTQTPLATPVIGPGSPQNAQSAPGANPANSQSPAQNQATLLAQGQGAQGGQNAALPNNALAALANAGAARRPRNDRDDVPDLTARPAPVNPQIDSGTGRLGAGALPDRGTVHLPDTGPNTEPGTPSAIGSGNGSNLGTPPNAGRGVPPSQGRVEIVITSQGNGGGTSKPAVNDNGSSLDSRSALEIARDLQSKQQYAKAVAPYKRALDGAGDSAAGIHQQIAMCYYRTGDKENAKSHYQQAIDSFKAQIAAGKNVESAKNGIRACENGIKVCE